MLFYFLTTTWRINVSLLIDYNKIILMDKKNKLDKEYLKFK